MSTNTRQKEPFHLYSRLSKPSRAPSVGDWLVNNGTTYGHAATAQASSVEEAYATLQEKRVGHGRKARFARVHDAERLQALGLGDVLVKGEQAWMLMPDERLEPIPYTRSTPWRSYPHTDRISSLSWSPERTSLVAGGSRGQVCIHRLTGEKKQFGWTSCYPDHACTIYAVAWSPDGTHIGSGGYDNEVHIWKPNPSGGYREAARGSLLICRVEHIQQSPIRCLTWAPDSRSLFAGRSDGCIVQWHAVTGAFLAHTKRHERAVTALALFPDAMTFASASEDATVRIWQDMLETSHDVIYDGHTHEVTSVAWSPDGNHMASGGKQDRHLHVWNPWTGEQQARIPLSISFSQPPGINAIAWSPTGRFIAAGCDDGTLQLVDLEYQRHIMTYRTTNGNGVTTVAWSPDGWWMATGGDHQWGNHAVEVWQAGLDLVLWQQDQQAEQANAGPEAVFL